MLFLINYFLRKILIIVILEIIREYKVDVFAEDPIIRERGVANKSVEIKFFNLFFIEIFIFSNIKFKIKKIKIIFFFFIIVKLKKKNRPKGLYFK